MLLGIEIVLTFSNLSIYWERNEKNEKSFNNHIGVPLTLFNLNDKNNFSNRGK